MNARRVHSAPTDHNSGVIYDHTIALNGYYALRNDPEHLHRIRFKDPELAKAWPP